MKRILYLVISILVIHGGVATAQTISANVTEINFNETSELEVDSVAITLSNPFGQPFTISPQNVLFLNTYGKPAFYIKNSTITIPPQGTASMNVYFKPRHNILHQSCMVIKSPDTDFFRNNGTLSISLTGQGRYSNPYYNTTQNLKEQDLRNALKAKISSGYTSLGYNTARNKMFEEIDNKRLNGQGATQNTLECTYTTTLCTGYANRTQAQSMCSFDTEHTFPQGFFNSGEPMLSDLYHLFPTRSNANNSRGNLPFGVATPPYQQEAINAPSKKGSNNVYEPHDGQKGATARAMMYFVVRYQDYNNFFAPQENVLRQWHNTHQPSPVEIRRNNDIAALQNNRNPFIDYPQLAERITKLVGPTSEVPTFSLNNLKDTIVYTHGTHRLNFNNDSTDVISYTLVNDGNQPCQIQQISTSDLRLKIINPQNTTISPGRAHTIKLYVKTPGLADFAQQSLQQQNLRLSYSTNIPGSTVKTIPIWIKSDITHVSDPVNAGASAIVYPNPSDRVLNIVMPQGRENSDTHFTLYDQLGHAIELEAEKIDNRHFRINIQDLPLGFYQLKILQSGKRTEVKKICIIR